jgi:tungstate transport system substrate-binding protein
MNSKRLLLALAVIGVLLTAMLFAGCTTPATPPTTVTPTATTTPAQQQDLLIATTTSLYDTGLLDYLAGIFGPANNANLRITAKGTGQALELGQNGDVDTVMVHDRVREDAFLANGYGIDRRVFAYNYFVIVGPPSDPAGIKNMTATQAFDTIYKEAQTNPTVVFVSRGDSSGTQRRV